MHLDLNTPPSDKISQDKTGCETLSPTKCRLHHTTSLGWKYTENKQASKNSLGKIMQLRTA